MKHHFLTPLQNAAPHVQSKQSLKLFFSESVDCLVCSDEDLRRNILTDFASINWLTVSTYTYTLNLLNCLPNACLCRRKIKILKSISLSCSIKQCTQKISDLFLKISQFQNAFWVSLFGPKYQRNFFQDFCPSL